MHSGKLIGPFVAAYHSSPIEVTLFDVDLPCGFPSPAADYEESSLDLHHYLIANRAATFFFTVAGFSMKNAGILDGDKVSVDRSIRPRHGHIVVAIVNQEYTLKRLFKQRGRIELHADNPDYQPIKFDDGDELSIWGVVTGVIRKIKV